MSAPRVVSITPEWAAAALMTVHEDQRHVRRGTVDRYVRTMKAGEWREEMGEAIAVTGTYDEPGTVQNGVHRLHAIRRFGKPVRCLFRENADPADLLHYDNGAQRSVSDSIGYTVPGINAGTRKIITSFLNPVLVSDPDKMPRFDVAADNWVMEDYIRQHRDALIHVAEVASSLSRMDRDSEPLTSLLTPRILGWLLWVTRENPDSEVFWRGYAERSFVQSDTKDVRATLIAKSRHTPFPRGQRGGRATMEMRAAWMCAAWNVHVGATRRWVVWDGRTETFPIPRWRSERAA